MLAFYPQTNVMLPLPIESTPGEVYSSEQIDDINVYLRDTLLHEWKTYTSHYFHAGAWWCRCSAQVFNEVRVHTLPARSGVLAAHDTTL